MTINEQILNAIDWSRANMYTQSEIETAFLKIILQSQLDLLNEVMNNNTWDFDQEKTFTSKISELKQQINNLTVGIAEGGIIGIRPLGSKLYKSLIVFLLLIAVSSAPLLAIPMLVAVR